MEGFHDSGLTQARNQEQKYMKVYDDNQSVSRLARASYKFSLKGVYIAE